jgi:hypothetical protein
MIKLIQNISGANDGEQNKDNTNNDNIIKYLELNKNGLLDLAEKHYENLVEVLANNVIDTASSNHTLSSLQSSSTFPNLCNQSDTHLKEEESEIYDNSKGDNSE